MGVSGGCVRWVCQVDTSGGCQVGVSFLLGVCVKWVSGGCVRWVCQVGVSSVSASGNIRRVTIGIFGGGGGGL